MFITEEKALARTRELGYSPIENTVICAKLAPYSEKTAIERGVDMLKDSMKFETPEGFYSILVCAENELVILPISWWTGTMKKDGPRTIPYADITGFKAPEAKTISWRGMLTTKGGAYELIISDEKLAALSIGGSALLKGDWQKTNLPHFVEKLAQAAGQ